MLKHPLPNHKRMSSTSRVILSSIVLDDGVVSGFISIVTGDLNTHAVTMPHPVYMC